MSSALGLPSQTVGAPSTTSSVMAQSSKVHTALGSKHSNELGIVIGILAIVIVLVVLALGFGLARSCRQRKVKVIEPKVKLISPFYIPHGFQESQKMEYPPSTGTTPRSSIDSAKPYMSRPCTPELSSGARTPKTLMSSHLVVLSPPTRLRLEEAPPAHSASFQNFSVRPASDVSVQDPTLFHVSTRTAGTIQAASDGSDTTSLSAQGPSSERPRRPKIDTTCHVTNRADPPPGLGRSPMKDAGPVLSPHALSLLPPRYTPIQGAGSDA